MSNQAGKKTWLSYLAAAMIGIWIGGAGFLFWYGQEMQSLMLTNFHLLTLNERLQEELAELKQTQNNARKKQEWIIEEIRVQVLDPKPDDEFTVTNVVRKLEKDVASLKGKKVDQVAEVHLILHEMLKRREYVVDNKVAEVHLKTAVISRTLQLFVTIETKNMDIGRRVFVSP